MFNSGLEMPNADTDTVNSSDKDEKLEMSNAYMIEQIGGPETDTVKSNDQDESNFNHSAAQVCIRPSKAKKEQRDKKMVLPEDTDELSTLISRIRRMLLDIILCTLSYMCVVLKCNESSIKDENSLNLHGCEFGFYKDIERNGLINDLKPWLEFGDFTRLRDDILLKIHSCVKKGILIFPDWVRQLKRTLKKNRFRKQPKKKNKKEQRQIKPN